MRLHVCCKYLLVSLVYIYLPSLQAQDAGQYIRNYKDIAVAEMLRTGIPASIKLAQGMLESSCGTSVLACKANNHFGIKCGGDWTGKKHLREDDDYHDGKLIKSCFREFDSAFESYIAHSDFLTDPKKAQRYGSLFSISSADYKEWARGLSRAGYATDPKYADKLIKIIEDNKLYQFDSGDDVWVSNDRKRPGSYAIERFQNDVRYVIAGDREALASIATQNDVSVKQLIKYNDQAFHENEIIPKGSKIYLQPKRSAYRGKQKYYVLKSGQDLLFVAQEYGIQLDALKKRNKIEGNQVPATGQKIYLKGKAKTPPKTINPYQTPELPVVQKQMTEMVDVAKKPATDGTNKSTPAGNQHATSSTQVAARLLPEGHTVGKGDTLFSIARNYGLSVDELKKRNNLSVDTIFVGQKLLVQ